MRARFFSRLALILLAGFLVVWSQVFTGAALEWVFFGGGVLTIALAGLDALHRGAAQRSLDALLGVLGAWTIIEALVFSGTALTWISFGSAAAVAAIAAAGLVLHEMISERVVHELAVTKDAGRPASPSLAA